ncbi:MAG TPA: hypothetical protein GXX28_06560, partial [Firmicutes bacterium]|nr:hypothetical protein [Bacillota bacterium]
DRFRLMQLADGIQAELQRLGFRFVALDLGGYRTGSLNRVLESAGAAHPPEGGRES